MSGLGCRIVEKNFVQAGFEDYVPLKSDVIIDFANFERGRRVRIVVSDTIASSRNREAFKLERILFHPFLMRSFVWPVNYPRAIDIYCAFVPTYRKFRKLFGSEALHGSGQFLTSNDLCDSSHSRHWSVLNQVNVQRPHVPAMFDNVVPHPHFAIVCQSKNVRATRRELSNSCSRFVPALTCHWVTRREM